MKNWKKALAFLLTLICVLSLTGCSLLLNVGINYDKKGKGALTVAVGMDEELYSAAQSMSEEEDLSEYKEFEYNGAKYYGSREVVEFSSFEELNAAMTTAQDVDDTDEAIFESFAADKHGLRAVPNRSYFEDEQYAEMKEMGVIFDMPFTITTEAEILSCNGTISGDRHTATWDMNSLPEEMVLETKVDFPYWIIIVAAILAILVILFVILKKKKAEAAAAAAVPEVTAEENAEPAVQAAKEAASETVSEAVNEAWEPSGEAVTENAEAAAREVPEVKEIPEEPGKKEE